jgi:hypothetical protein
LTLLPLQVAIYKLSIYARHTLIYFPITSMFFDDEGGDPLAGGDDAAAPAGDDAAAPAAPEGGDENCAC